MGSRRLLKGCAHMARRLDALAFLRLLSGYFCSVMVSNCGHYSTGRPMPLLIHGPFTSETLAFGSLHGARTPNCQKRMVEAPVAEDGVKCNRLGLIWHDFLPSSC
jgi:hypothetical protein